MIQENICLIKIQVSGFQPRPVGVGQRQHFKLTPYLSSSQLSVGLFPDLTFSMGKLFHTHSFSCKVVSPAWGSLLSTRCYLLVYHRDISYSDQSNYFLLKSCLHLVPSTFLEVNSYITYWSAQIRNPWSSFPLSFSF